MKAELEEGTKQIMNLRMDIFHMAQRRGKMSQNNELEGLESQIIPSGMIDDGETLSWVV